MSNAILLKRAMKCLGLSGTALAKMISKYRDDGKLTAPETVSRWINGTNPVDPAVIGWLSELVRSKALKLEISMTKWPASGTFVIAIVNAKGGIGSTTLAQNLAVVSEFDFRLKTRHFAVSQRGDSDLAQQALQDLGISSDIVTPKEMLAYKRSQHEVVIMDINADIARDAVNGQPGNFLYDLAPDLFLVPADLGSGADAKPTKRFVELTGLNAMIKILHLPRLLSMRFMNTISAVGLDEHSNLFLPEFIPHDLANDIHIPKGYDNEWRSEDQHERYIRLFDLLIEAVGGHVKMPHEAQKLIAGMTLDDLLDYVESYDEERKK